jgi:hypothetical protein
MIDEITFMLTLHNSSEQSHGKMIIYNRQGLYETHWLKSQHDHEELEVLYSGEEVKEAWRTAQTWMLAKNKDGFQLSTPFFSFPLTTLPKNLLFQRKLECFGLIHPNEPLFLELKNLRKKLSASIGIPPYFIGTDRLLYVISALCPHQIEELIQLPGIGRNKIEQYGPQIIEITKKYPQLYSFPLHWIHEEISNEDLMFWLIEDKLLKEKKEEERIKKEQEDQIRILRLVQDNMTIEDASQQLSMSAANYIKKLHQLALSGYDIVPYIRSEVDRIQERDTIQQFAGQLGFERLKPIFEQMYGDANKMPAKERGDRYNQIRLVCTYLQLKSA